MKKRNVLWLLMLAFIATTAQAQKTYLTTAETPKEIVKYVEQHFPDASIQKVKKEVDFLKTEYEVKLMPKAELEFDENFNLIEVESKMGIPVSTLPNAIHSYISEAYPNVGVKEWQLKPKGQKVKLLNGIKLYFDLDNQFLGRK